MLGVVRLPVLLELLHILMSFMLSLELVLVVITVLVTSISVMDMGTSVAIISLEEVS